MYLVVNQVVQLEHINHAYGNFLFERLTGPSVKQNRLTVCREARHGQQIRDLSLFSAVEHRVAMEIPSLTRRA